MSTQTNKRLQNLKRIKDEIFDLIIEYKYEIKRLRNDIDNIDSIRFNLPNDKVEFALKTRWKIRDLEQHLDEQKQSLHDVEEEIAEEEKRWTH